MRRLAALAVTAGIAACSPAKPDKATLTDVAADHAVKAGFNPGAPAPLATDSLDPVKTPAPGALLPPASLKYRYIGRWATSADLCGTAPWLFESKKLSSADGETSCSFTDSATVLAEYRLTGTCSANHQRSPDVVTMKFDEAKRTMRVEGKSLGFIDLLYCGG